MTEGRSRFRKPGWLVLGAVVLIAIAWAAWPRLARLTGASDALPIASAPAPDDTLARAPAGTRIRVQVVNATTVRGLGRRATFHLRDHGFDVVEVANTRERREQTVVLDRSGHTEWAQRVARAMGGAAIEARPDSSRYLDVTVLVGRSWTAPAEPFHP